MNDTSYSDRIKLLALIGIRIGALTTFWSSLAFVILFIAAISLFDITAPANPSSLPLWFQVVGGALAVGRFMYSGGIIPATMIGAIGGLLISLALAFWKKEAPSVLAGCIGLLIGIILILTINYFIWLGIYRPNNASSPISFFDFFSFSRDPIYFIPSVIAILISAYLGWKINKVQASGINEKQS